MQTLRCHWGWIAASLVLSSATGCGSAADPSASTRVVRVLPPNAPVVNWADLTEKPQMLVGFRRQAPGVRKAPLTRDIQVECVIRPDGIVHSARVVGEHDEDVRGWIADMMSREFRPGKVNGEPVWCRMTVTIREDSIPAGPSDPVGVSL